MFWVNNGADITSVQSSKLTGADRQVIVRASGNVLLVGLCTDVDKRRLYWSEFGSILSSDYDGNDVRRFPLPPSFAGRLIGLSVGAVSMLMNIHHR